MQQKVESKIGLRWSPKPMKEYLASAQVGPGVAEFHRVFFERPDVWNLVWISAANWEQPPHLSGLQVQFLVREAQRTASAFVGGQRVVDLSLALMPEDFADVLEANLKEAQELALFKALWPHWLWVIRDRARLFYEARKSDYGLAVPETVRQGETILKESTNIVSLFKLKGQPR